MAVNHIKVLKMKNRRHRGFYCKAAILSLGMFCWAMAQTPPKPVIPNATFDITAFGALADGVTDNAAAVQAAIDSASRAGGGVVVVPQAVKPYECGPIILASSINLQIKSGAVLQCLPYAKYPLTATAYAHFIFAANVHDVEISGSGTIDGQGAAWWAAFNANGSMPHRPYLIKFSPCTTVYVHDVTLSNSPMFHFAIYGVNVTFDGVTIMAPSNAPNTDGIDPGGSNILIENCTISTGDDNVAVKPGNNPCKNITITKCVFGTGHGVSVGGQTNFGLDSLNVSHCTFNATTNGIRLKANRTCGGIVQNLVYSDITMNKVAYPVLITSYYEEVFSVSDSMQPVTDTTPIWKNITIRNLVSTNSTNAAVTLQGLPEAPIQNITFANAAFTGSKVFSLTHAHGVNLFNTTFNGVGAAMPISAVDATIAHLSITAQPKSQSVALGATLSLNAAFTADFSPRFQWFHNNAAMTDGGDAVSAVSGATSATLSVTGVLAADGGAYSVSLSDSCGSILSDSAIIVVKDANEAVRGSNSRLSKTAAYNGTAECISPAGRLVAGPNRTAPFVNSVYFTRDQSGAWKRSVRMGTRGLF
jgi:polygalacturonase